MDTYEALASVDIVDYVSQFVDLTDDGKDFWGLSPFKSENTPSFSVSKDDQVFFDFSSGQGGNVIDFIRLYNKCGVGEAFKILYEYIGADPASVASETQKSPIMSVLKKYKRKEKHHKESAGIILPDNTMENYEWREDKFQIWINEGITVEELKKYQVRYDAVCNRIVFPVRSLDGKIINICGRTLDPDFKEHKQRKYGYYHSLGTLDTLCGFYENQDEIRSKKEIILFEGVKSVMKADAWGYKNCAAVMTSHINFNQLKFLISLRCRVVFALDSDVNIFEDKNIEKLKRFVSIEYIDSRSVLKEKMAPVDNGKETWDALYEARQKMN